MPSASIAAASSGANEIVATPGAGRKIHVTGWVMVGAGAGAAKWVNGSSDVSGALLFAAASVNVAPKASPRNGWFDCSDNAALNLSLNTTVAVNGLVDYEVVPSGS